MCGRYTLTREERELREQLGYTADLPFVPRYNIAPTQMAPVIVSESGRPTLKPMRWGLVPDWSKDEKSGYRMINAKAETLGEKPAFRRLFERRRCLVPADSFFEGKKVADGKQPFRFMLRSGCPFAFAGLWDRWRRGEGTDLESFTIVTTAANSLAAPLHDRMPVILSPSDYRSWIDVERSEPERLKTFLGPYPAEEMQCHPVSRTVNSARNDTPECIEELPRLW